MKNIRKQKTFRQIHERWMMNDEYRRTYEGLGLEFELIAALAGYRLDSNLSQRQLAKKIGTTQSAIARFESGNYNPSLAFVQKLVRALDLKLIITKNDIGSKK
jgi:transcriptional regulator with XRE-family HTH domain